MKSSAQSKNAYLTIVLALCLTLVLSLCLTLIEGVRLNAGQLEAECIAEIASQSVMAEYHRELLRQYNLFAIDGSYGTQIAGVGNVEARLRYYVENNLNYDDIFLSEFLYRDFLGLQYKEAEVTGVSIMADDSGAVFRQCAVEAVKDDVGLGLLEELQGWLQSIEVNGLENSDRSGEKQALDEEIASYNGTIIETDDGELDIAEVTNPTDALEEKRRLGILKQVTTEEALSQKVISTAGLIEDRMQQGKINQGNIVQEKKEGLDALTESFLFREYLVRYMGHYGAEQEEDVLKYQLEYLIAGTESDVENLRTIANRICAIREAANAIYLMSSEEKWSEIVLLAEVVCSLIGLPELIPLMEGAILLGWAYAESVYDVKTLMAGGEVPLLKDDESWHYGLSTALAGEITDYGQQGEGLSYEDYLRVFLMLTDDDGLTKRAMNLIELDIRNTCGNEAFRLDACYVIVEADIVIESTYGYRYDLICRKNYE